MNKDEMKNRISFALKDPILQQGFEIICKENAELTEQNTSLLTSVENLNKSVQELEAQIEQLQKINSEQKETLKKVRVALIQERTANIMNYGKGGVEMFDSMFEILKGVSN